MSKYHEWLKLLQENKSQWDAFQKPGNTVVIAGPGSGKTRVLAMKIAQLLRDEIAPPQGVACVTYTRMMARELERRIFSLGVRERPNVVVGTLHSFCLGHVVQPFAKLYQLGLPDPIRIAPQSVWDECLDQARFTITGENFDPSQDQNYKTNLTKYHLQRIDVPFSKWENQIFANVLELHYETLNQRGFIDFDLVVKAALNLISNHELVRQSLHAKFAWLAVDEYQDLGYPLFRIVTQIIDNTPTKLFAIGDPDQSIFDFAGTDPRYLHELAQREDMQPVIELEHNYRSFEQIVNVCKKVLTPYCNYESVRGLTNQSSCIVCEIGNVRPIGYVLSRLIEMYHVKRGIPLHKIAILHPWRLSRDGSEGIQIIANILDAEKIKYVLDKHPLFDRSKALITWLEALALWCLVGWSSNKQGHQECDFDDLQRQWEVIRANQVLGVEQNTEDRILLTRTLWDLRGQNLLLRDWFSEIHRGLQLNIVLANYNNIFPDDVSEFNKLVDLAAEDGELSNWRLEDFANLSSGVQLTTLHSSKGMEFEAVIIAGIERIWNDENGTRLFYVGATRAERELSLLYRRIWPENNPQTPRPIQQLVQRCSTFDYFRHYPLER